MAAAAHLSLKEPPSAFQLSIVSHRQYLNTPKSYRYYSTQRRHRDPHALHTNMHHPYHCVLGLLLPGTREQPLILPPRNKSAHRCCCTPCRALSAFLFRFISNAYAYKNGIQAGEKTVQTRSAKRRRNNAVTKQASIAADMACLERRFKPPEGDVISGGNKTIDKKYRHLGQSTLRVTRHYEYVHPTR